MSEQQLLESFSSALGEADSDSTFACGGNIPIILDSTTTPGNTERDIESRVSDQVIATKLVTIRYGAPGQGQTLRLPTDTTKDPAFLNLINASTKLDTSDFCTDFCPYETGIIDIVSQLLMPSTKRKATSPVESEEFLPAVRADVELLHAAIEGSCGFDSMTVIEIITSRSPSDLASIMKIYKERYDQRLEQVLERRLEDIDLFLLDILAEACSRDVRAQTIAEPAQAPTGIRAELYKLNFYSGPFGKFKAHVDTPRSGTQIGSLVVCLPSESEGGNLSVSHQGNTVEFDWSAPLSTGQAPCIQWAAFHSDCCHEVQEVTAGHCVTLTYNLYASRGSGLLAGKNHTMDATRLPIYRPLVNLLGSHTFMNEGGLMAIGLAHTYPYTHALLHRNMPAALKGADMMLCEVLLALNFRAEFIRVMDLSTECAEVRANYYDPYDGEDHDDEMAAVPRDEDAFYRLGFEAMEISDNMIEKSDLRDGMPGWNRLGPVKWIRHPQDSQLEIAHLAYGNEATMATKYSQAAIVVSVPSVHLRPQMLGDSSADFTLGLRS